MITPIWMKWTLGAIAAAVLAVLGLSIYLWSAVDDASERIAHLDDQVVELAYPDGAFQSAAKKIGRVDESIASLEEENRAIRDRLDALLLKLRANGKRLDDLEAGDLADLGLEELIDKRLGEKIIEGRTRALKSRIRTPVDKLGEQLDLTERQKKQITTALDRAKEEVYEVMTAERDDGGSLMQDMVDILRGPDRPRRKKRKILGRLFNGSAPGSDQSYFTDIMEIRAEAADSFQNALNDEQLGAFKKSGMSIFGIQTGYTPFTDSIQDAFEGQ